MGHRFAGGVRRRSGVVEPEAPGNDIMTPKLRRRAFALRQFLAGHANLELDLPKLKVSVPCLAIYVPLGCVWSGKSWPSIQEADQDRNPAPTPGATPSPIFRQAEMLLQSPNFYEPLMPSCMLDVLANYEHRHRHGSV